MLDAWSSSPLWNANARVLSSLGDLAQPKSLVFQTIPQVVVVVLGDLGVPDKRKTAEKLYA